MDAIAILEQVTSDNSRVIEKYIQEQKRGLSERRKTKIRVTLGKLGRVHLKERLSQVTKTELEDFIEALRNDDLEESYEESTKTTYLKIAKPFFAWLHPEDPKFSSWIRTGSYQATVTPEDILTPAERNMMLSCCVTPRDKTMFQSLYESAARPKEFVALLRSDLSFEDDCANLHVRKGKTGFPRDITLVQDAHPLLRNWVFNEHPLREEKDFPLWIDMSRNSKHEPLQQIGLRRFMERLSKSAKIQKRVTPYTLRHTRLTDLARENASEALLSLIAGWRPGSKMPSVYIHLSKRDQKPALKKLLGLSKDDEKEEERRKLETPKPKICSSCRTVNPSDARVCSNCRMALDTKTAVDMIQEREGRIKSLEKQVASLTEGLAAINDLALRLKEKEKEEAEKTKQVDKSKLAP